VSDSGRRKEVDGNHYLGERLKMEENSKIVKNSSAISTFYRQVRALSPFCSHLGLFDSGLSFGVKEILFMFLSSEVQIYILKGNSWPFSPPHLIV